MPHDDQGVPCKLHAPDRPTAADAAESQDAEVSAMCGVCLPAQHLDGSKTPGVASWQSCANPGLPRTRSHESSSSKADSSDSQSCSHEGEESISEDENFISVTEVCVEKHKYWTTMEDQALAKIDALAQELRDKPLLPPHPQDPNTPWLDATSGIALPICHCAFLGCSWVSPRSPCRAASASGSMWQGSKSCWTNVPPRRLDESGAYACCGQASCLREHLVVAHAAALQKTCGLEGFLSDSYDYYLEAVAVRERQSMPKVGCSVDRRTFQHVKEDLADDSVRALVCMCCQCIATTSNGNTKIGFINAFDYFFKMIRPGSFDWNWDFNKYRSRFVLPQGGWLFVDLCMVSYRGGFPPPVDCVRHKRLTCLEFTAVPPPPLRL